MHKFSQGTRPCLVILQLLPQSKCLIWIFKLVILEIGWGGGGRSGWSRKMSTMISEMEGHLLVLYSLLTLTNTQTTNPNYFCFLSLFKFIRNVAQPMLTPFFANRVDVQVSNVMSNFNSELTFIATCKTFTSWAERYCSKKSRQTAGKWWQKMCTAPQRGWKPAFKGLILNIEIFVTSSMTYCRRRQIGGRWWQRMCTAPQRCARHSPGEPLVKGHLLLNAVSSCFFNSP